METIVADTHVLLWYLFEPEKLSTTAENTIEQILQQQNKISVSAISIVEIIYLVEKGRLSPNMLSGVNSVLTAKDTVFELISVDFKIAIALQKVNRASVPDMPDRIIAATAIALNVPLITRDHKIRISEVNTIW